MQEQTPEIKMEELEPKESKKRTYKKRKTALAVVVEEDPDQITVDPLV
jgi:hypothetical protein